MRSDQIPSAMNVMGTGQSTSSRIQIPIGIMQIFDWEVHLLTQRYLLGRQFPQQVVAYFFKRHTLFTAISFEVKAILQSTVSPTIFDTDNMKN